MKKTDILTSILLLFFSLTLLNAQVTPTEEENTAQNPPAEEPVEEDPDKSNATCGNGSTGGGGTPPYTPPYDPDSEEEDSEDEEDDCSKKKNCDDDDPDSCSSQSSGSTSDGVNHFNTYTGNVVRDIVDLQVFARSGYHQLRWVRRGASRHSGPRSRIFGDAHNWRHSYQWEMSREKRRAVIRISYPQGGTFRFTQSNANKNYWMPPANVPEILIQDGDLFTLKTAGNERHIFERMRDSRNRTFYRYTHFFDRYNNRYNLTYVGNGRGARLSRITDPAGRFLAIDWESVTLANNRPQRLGTFQNVSSGWQELTFTKNQRHRSIQIQPHNRGFLEIAEIEVFDHNGNRLEGTPIGSPSNEGPENAFDGDPDTFYRYTTASQYAFVGLDFGPRKRIGKVRILPVPGQETSLENARLMAYVGRSRNQSLISRVSTDDGRFVEYGYEMIEDNAISVDWPALTQVTYDDETQAHYSYQFLYEGAQPLLETMLDPRISGKGTSIRYTFKTGSRPTRRGPVGMGLGILYQEIDDASGQVLAKIGLLNVHAPIAKYPSGNITYKMHGGRGNANLKEKIDATGAVTRYGYGAKNSSGFLTKKTDALGRETNFERDSYGRVSEKVHPDGMTERWERDENGFVVSYSQTAEGITRSRSYERDEFNRPVRITYSDGSFKSFTYNDFGKVQERTERNGGKTVFEFNDSGQKVSKTDPEGNTTTYTWHPSGLLASETDALGRVTYYEWNSRGLLVKTIYPDNSTEETVYDDFGNVIQEADVSGNLTSYRYDSLRNKVSETNALGQTTEYSFDIPNGADCGSCARLQGRPLQVIESNGRVTDLTYDPNGRVTRQVREAGSGLEQTSSYSYDLAGNRLSTTNALGHTTSFAWDERNRLIKRIDALGQEWKTSYNGFGQRTQSIRPDGSSLHWSYDSAGRLLPMQKETSGVVLMTGLVRKSMRAIRQETKPCIVTICFLASCARATPMEHTPAMNMTQWAT